MTKQFKPMLAAAAQDLTDIVFPVLASPKLDGIRCVIRNGKALSRSLKPIPNQFIRAKLESLANWSGIEGLDGELMVDDVPFQEVTSAVMSKTAEPPADWYFGVFDLIDGFEPFCERLQAAHLAVAHTGSTHVRMVDHELIDSLDQLLAYEADCLAEGFEGVMLRDPEGRYKYGRSTVREGGLLKLKRFLDDEARIIGTVEQWHNENEAFTGELGQTKRSSAKAGKVAAGTLGALLVEHETFGKFEIGTGFTMAQRDELWQTQPIGQLVKFKYQPVGVKDKPRCPVFLGMRHEEDL